MDPLAYPIGRFDVAVPISAADRARAVADVAALPEQLHRLVQGATDAQLDTPYRPGGWSLRQVVHHLADSHLNAYVRYKLALTQPEPLVNTYQEARWAELPDSALPVGPSVAILANVHLRWTTILAALTEAQWQRTVRHPDLGVVSLHQYVGLYAWHGRHHLAHLRLVLGDVAP